MLYRLIFLYWKSMVFIVTIVLGAIYTTSAQGGTTGRALYIAPDGNDLNDGLTLATPFQTIQRCAEIAVAGDTCFIRAGTYRETVRPAHSGVAGAPITFTAYNNEDVMVSGLDVISEWTLVEGSIYRASMPWTVNNNGGALNEITPSVNDQVFVDGVMMVEARWPNIDPARQPELTRADNARADAVRELTNQSATYLDSALTDAGSFWAGGKINLGPGFSIIYTTCDITQIITTALNFTCSQGWDSAMLRPSAQNNYFLWGKREALDAPGEWFREGPSDAGSLFLWLPNNANPQAHVVEAKRRVYAFDFHSRSHIVLEGVTLFGASIQMHNGILNPENISEYIHIHNITGRYLWHAQHMQGFFTLNGNTGIRIRGNYNEIRDSFFDTSAGSMIMLRGNGNVISNNVFANMGYNGASVGVSGRLLTITGTHNLLSQNTFFNAGRYPIQADQGLDILYNDVYASHLQISDLGVIYGWGTDGRDAQIAYNFVHDSWGERNLDLNYFGAHGIYLDDDTYNYHIYRNVIWNTTAPGIFTFGTNGTTNPAFPPPDAPSNRFIYHNTVDGDMSAAVKSNYNGLPQTLNGTAFYNNVSTSHAIHTSATVGSHYVGDALHLDRAAQRYELRSYSPAIDAGIDLGSPYNDPPMQPNAAPDLGAYEFGRPAFVAGAVLRSTDLAQLNISCTALASGLTADCIVRNLPVGRKLPPDFMLRIGNGLPTTTCITEMNYATHVGIGRCEAVDVAGQSGLMPIQISLGTEPWFDASATVDLGPLAVFAVNPTHGPISGNTLVSITGRKFHQAPAHSSLPITLSNALTTTLYFYQVQVNLDTAQLISDGKLQADCADLRFVDAYGQLPYWIEQGCNTNNTRIWVKLMALPPGISTITLFYGSPLLNAASNGPATFAFFDDFADGSIGSMWTAVNNGAVMVREELGVMRIIGTTDVNNRYTPIGFALNMWQVDVPESFAIDLDWSIVQQSTIQPFKAVLGAAAHVIGLYSTSPTNRDVGFWDGSQFVSLGESTIDSHTFEPQRISTAWTPNGVDEVVRYYENGVLQAQRSVSSSTSKGMFNYSPNAEQVTFDVRFDNVRIRQVVFPEPTVQLGSEVNHAVAVSFNNQPCSKVTVISSTYLRCFTPPHAVGTVDVQLINPDQTHATLTNAYTYRDFWQLYLPTLR